MVLNEVVKYVGPSDLYGVRPFFALEAVLLKNALTAEQWMAEYMQSNNYTSQGFKTYSDDHVEAVFVYVDRSDSFIVRAAVRRNGNVMALARYVIPETQWADASPIQEAAIQGFSFKNTNEERVEDFQSFRFLDVAEAEYPLSWEFVPGDLRSIDRMGATFLKISKRQDDSKIVRALEGKVMINLVSSYVVSDLEKELDRFRRELVDNSVTIVSEIEDAPQWTYGDHISFANNRLFHAQRSYEGSLKDFELWVSVLGIGEYYYLAGLLTPSRDEEFSRWARNTRSYQLMLQSMRLLTD